MDRQRNRLGRPLTWVVGVGTCTRTSKRWIACGLVAAMAACAQPSSTPHSQTAEQSSRARPEGQTSWTLEDESDQLLEPDTASRPEDDAPERGPFTVAIVSDLNGSYGSTDYGDEVHASVRWIRDELEPDLVLSTGDMVAGQRDGLDYDAMWRGFHTAVSDPLAAADIPLAVTPGNHDASAGAVYTEERVEFIEQWRARRPDVEFVDDSFYPLYYAFEAGGALFISLDATVTGPIDDEQRAWLAEILRENVGYETKIVFGHVPLHPFSEERRTEILDDVQLEALLERHGVDVMATGHHHAYYPGRRDELRVLGMACLGSGRRTLVGDERESARSVAVLEVDAGGGVSIRAFRPDGSEVDRESLPRSLNSGRHRIVRDDLEAGDET